MSLKDKLEIFLITFNRKKNLENTLRELFAEDSPVRDLDITILNNHSTDGTTELVDEYCQRYPNLKQIVHPINIGAGANTIRAYELAQKPYLWVLCDNDTYCWSSFAEIENAINNDCPFIFSVNFRYTDENKWSEFFQSANFISACIIKRSEIDSTSIINAYHNIDNCFPQLAIAAKMINEQKEFYSVSVSIVNWLPNTDSPTRSHDKKLTQNRRNWFLLWGYLRSTIFITDAKIRNSILKNCNLFTSNAFKTYIKELAYAKWNNLLTFKHIVDILFVLPLWNKIIFIFACLWVSLRLIPVKNLFYVIPNKDTWLEYFKAVNQQKKINKLVRTYKNQKVLLYGAGMFFDALNEYCDLSKFNICGLSDNKFAVEQVYKGYNVVPVNKISDLRPDVIILCVAEPKFVLPQLRYLKCPKVHVMKKCTLDTFFVL